MAIRQTVSFKSTPKRTYELLTSSKAFAEVTGAPADISTDEGGQFSCFGGQISGRHIELRPSERIVQAWRAGSWEPGVYSMVRFDIGETETGSTVTLQQSANPKGSSEDLEGGWHKMYWEPLTAFIG